MKSTIPKRSGLLAGCVALACGLGLAASALAAEDDLVFDYTRIELDGGTTTRAQSAATWTGDGWIGTDFDRLWWKTQGDLTSGRVENGDLQVLYSRYIATFWDLQAGYRHEFKPGQRNQGVVAIKGLAPYWFEVDAALFLGGRGAASGRISVEYELLWTQRLISRPEVSVDWRAAADPWNELGHGLTRAEFSLQTRYEITRKIAPYVSVRYERALGQSADLVRAAGGSVGSTAFTAGIRLIF